MIPEHMKKPFQLWIDHAIPPGSFGMAIITNDLKQAVMRADHININHIPQIVQWFYNYAPAQCWGSVENAENWKGRCTITQIIS